ncbi:transglutaminase family protein [Yoonia litorea]|uniref:Transglutaminase-like enzyme, putative cysteine protease n=1 Tax=Yoonia litorea TaxID=1123755 RepID=A0A1I6M6L3_9RHOB|nr:transglutaminase family protein [Yoonia litorea]SFS11344.1 Transglutaminase-like enzyme, putative cysteine protease [Yoonia litorea]
MLLKIRHTTTYRYDQPVVYALQKVRLRPLENPFQAVNQWEIQISGGQIEAHYADQYGNHVDLVNVDRDAQEVTITAAGEVETSDNAGVFGMVYGRAPLWHFQQHTKATTPCENIAGLANGLRSASDQIAALHELSAKILDRIPYEIGATNPKTTAQEALALGAGVCQDHAQVFIAAARAEGLPARYISGYLMMNDRVDQDATHAWAEVHVNGLGWVGFDVSNGTSPDERYVRIAIGRDARDAAPIEGLLVGQAQEQMIVSLQVQQ